MEPHTLDFRDMRILVIEDNADILANLCAYLEPLGHEVDCARDGLAGLAYAEAGTYDAIVLDVMLPRLDGLEVCRRLRQQARLPTPVLMLTARDTLEDKLAGFNSGADDYLVKPFFLEELAARLNSLVTRSRGERADTVLVFADLRVDTATLEATRAGRRIETTPIEFRILVRLLRAAPHVVSRENLEREIWGDQPPASEALRSHVHMLRRALDQPFARPMLRTVHGVGYRLVNPDAP